MPPTTGSSKGSGLAAAEDKKFCTATMPSPVVALTSATGVPNWRASDSTSTWPPCLRSSSAMFSNTSVGRPSAMTRPANTRWLCRLVEFRTTMIASGRGVPGILSVQDIDRHLFVFRLGSQTIDAGQIDQRDFVAFGITHISGVVFDGDAGKIADFLAQTSEAVEKCGLTGIRRSNDSDRAIRRSERFILGPGYRMAAHCRGSHASVSKRGCPEQFDMDVAGQVAAHGNFGPFHAVNAGIATRTGACDRDFQAGHEAQVHEVLRHGRGEFHVAQDGALADA